MAKTTSSTSTGPTTPPPGGGRWTWSDSLGDWVRIDEDGKPVQSDDSVAVSSKTSKEKTA